MQILRAEIDRCRNRYEQELETARQQVLELREKLQTADDKIKALEDELGKRNTKRTERVSKLTALVATYSCPC